MTNPENRAFGSYSLSIREYFAGLAMQNIQNVLLRKSGEDLLNEAAQKVCISGNKEKVIARLAVLQADALIKELNGEENPSD